MCSLKPLAFCTHRNFKNIQKRPINSSGRKMWGKNRNFDTESFSKTIKFIRDHFQTRIDNSMHCSRSPGGSERSRQALVHSLLSVEIVCLWSTSTRFMFQFQNHRMSRNFFCLFIGSWHRGNCHTGIIGVRRPCGLLVLNFRCLWRPGAHQTAALPYYQGGGGHKARFHCIKQSRNKSWNEVQPLLFPKLKKVLTLQLTLSNMDTQFRTGTIYLSQIDCHFIGSYLRVKKGREQLYTIGNCFNEVSI